MWFPEDTSTGIHDNCCIIAMAGQHIGYRAVQPNGAHVSSSLHAKAARNFYKTFSSALLGEACTSSNRVFHSPSKETPHVTPKWATGLRFVQFATPAKQRTEWHLASPFSTFENAVLRNQTLQHSAHLWFNKPVVRVSNERNHQARRAKLWLDANEVWVQNSENNIQFAVDLSRSIYLRFHE